MSKEILAAVKDGEIKLGESVIPCAVLNDEKRTRVLSQNEIVKALGRAPGGSKRGEAKLPRWISAGNISPYISVDLMKAILEPIEYITTKGRRALGIEAKYLPQICTVWLEAKDDDVLTEHQEETAVRANILIRGLAHVGIIALIDEATGYQYEREQNELQVILKALVSDEILDWQRQFQLSFYREIYRLWDIPFTPDNIKHKPQFIGHLTNKYIYSNLPKGTIVLEKLKEKTPRTKGGHWKYKLHQSLTKDAGRETLKKVLYSVEALASISKDKRDFERLMNEKYGQKEIPFPEMDSQIEAQEKQNKAILNPSDFNKNLLTALNYNPKDGKGEE